jgi:RNA polymerase sigma-70 factor, ECF subfamily
MVIMQGGGSAGRRGPSGASRGTSTDWTGASQPRASWDEPSGGVALLPAPSEALAEGDPVGTYPASADGADAGAADIEPADIESAGTGAADNESADNESADTGAAGAQAADGPNGTGPSPSARPPANADELFRTAYPKLAGWVRRLVDDDDTAHEIASEAFVRLLSRWTRVDSPQSYLYMIATNLVRDHWRKTERERRAMRSFTAGVDAEAVTHPGQDVDIRNLIETLPAKLRDPFLLHYYAGFAIREVAALLHRPEGTIKADLFAARAKLKTALGDRDA